MHKKSIHDEPGSLCSTSTRAKHSPEQQNVFILFRFPAGKFQLIMQKISHMYFQNYQPVRINK